MKKMTLEQVKAMADKVMSLTIEEARALPDMLGRIAPAMMKAHGYYAYVEHPSGRKVFIETRA